MYAPYRTLTVELQLSYDTYEITMVSRAGEQGVDLRERASLRSLTPACMHAL
jgi:hypothetical protein